MNFPSTKACSFLALLFISISNLLAQNTRLVTVADYATFLNRVATSDPCHLYHSAMGSDPATASILRLGTPGKYFYVPISGRENFPIYNTTLLGEARFCNWMQNRLRAVEGEQENNTEDGVYRLNETNNIVAKNSDATFWVSDDVFNDQKLAASTIYFSIACNGPLELTFSATDASNETSYKTNYEVAGSILAIILAEEGLRFAYRENINPINENPNNRIGEQPTTPSPIHRSLIPFREQAEERLPSPDTRQLEEEASLSITSGTPLNSTLPPSLGDEVDPSSLEGKEELASDQKTSIDDWIRSFQEIRSDLLAKVNAISPEDPERLSKKAAFYAEAYTQAKELIEKINGVMSEDPSLQNEENAKFLAYATIQTIKTASNTLSLQNTSQHDHEDVVLAKKIAKNAIENLEEMRGVLDPNKTEPRGIPWALLTSQRNKVIRDSEIALESILKSNRELSKRKFDRPRPKNLLDTSVSEKSKQANSYHKDCLRRSREMRRQNPLSSSEKATKQTILEILRLTQEAVEATDSLQSVVALRNNEQEIKAKKSSAFSVNKRKTKKVAT